MSDKIAERVKEAREYLETGGLTEVYEMARMALLAGAEKVQMDTDMAVALCHMYLDLIEPPDAPKSQPSSAKC